MKTYISTIGFLAVIAISFDASLSQAADEPQIVYRTAQATGLNQAVESETWTVSYSRVYAPEVFGIDSVQDSQAAAQAAVERLQAWNKRIQANEKQPEWQLAVILVEQTIVTHTTQEPVMTPADRFARTVIALETLLRQTRDTAAMAGEQIPDVGEVLNDYRKSIENATENAQKLKVEYRKLQGKITDKEFSKINQLIDGQVGNRSATFLQSQRQLVARLTMNDWEKKAKVENTTADLVEQIAKSKDPVAQKALVAELQTRQQTGEIRKSAVAEGKYEQARARQESSTRALKDLRETMAKSEEILLEIVNRNFEPAWLVNTTWGGKSYWLGEKSDWIPCSGAFLVTFREHGKCVILVGENEKTKTVKRIVATWKYEYGSILVRGFYGADAEIKFPANSDSIEMVALANSKLQKRLTKGWGMRAHPPTGYYTAYSWQLVKPGEAAAYTRAD